MSAVVLGTGAVTSIGLNAPFTAAAQRAGIAGHGAHPFMLDRTGEPMVVSRVPGGEQEMDGVARLNELVLPAAREALGRFRAERPIDLLLALPEGRPGLHADHIASVEATLIDGLAGDFRIGRHKALRGGHSAGITCLGLAAKLIAREPDTLLLVGGVDSWLAPETLEWLDSREVLHSEIMPWGFCPGEAAAFCLIGGDHRGGRLSIVAVGEGMEQNRIRTETVCTGSGMTAAWRSALASLSNRARRVDHIWCDLNSEPYRADEIAFAVLRTGEQLGEEVDISTPADCWGDVGAASGPLLVLAASYAAAKDYAPGPLSLISTSSEGGSRAAALLYDQGWTDDRQ